MGVQVRHALLDQVVQTLMVNDNTDQLRVVVERDEALEEHGQHPKGLLFAHYAEESADDEVESLAVADLRISDGISNADPSK